MVGDFGALNSYTVPDRYPIPRIQEALTQLSKAKYITSMDALKGFHQNVLTPKAKRLLRIITNCAIYEYLRMPFGIKNAPSHYPIMMNTIFLTELSEEWLIIYIDDIIIFSDSWSLNLERLARVLEKFAGVNINILLKKCKFGFEDKALGHFLSGLSLGINKNKVEAVLLKPIPQNKKEIMSFLRFASYYSQHLKDFTIIAKSLYRICDQQTVFEMKEEKIRSYEKINTALTEAPLLLIQDRNIPFKLYIDASGDGVGAALHQVQIIDNKPTEGPEPKSPWEVVHMDWVIALPPSGDKSYNECLLIVDRYSKTHIFLPCHKDDTAMDTALLIWNRAISHTGLFKNIISGRDPKFTSALWTNLHRLFGTKPSISTVYHPQHMG
ncbi:hypothetical protein O181_051717 [Austropuccinia psidii MF-1]|uniref:Integrase catalytic domain-containing protein n=1 Tax=Austropuccinia psidii MF-1 TaxID=1389203 RepID=A0A9Q3E1H2_9BASI|nr:hypothetical protein [Austropuccinia psidii MF-1]